MLQNHIADREFPVPADRRFLAEAHASWSPSAQMSFAVREYVGQLATLGLFIAGFWVVASAGAGQLDPWMFVLGLVLIALCPATLYWALGPRFTEKHRPRLEQLHYLKTAAQPDVDEDQQRLLSLALPLDFLHGTWNSSLAWAPCWTFLSPEWQARQQQDLSWSPYRTLTVVDPASLRDRLDREFGITVPFTVERALQQVLGSGSLSMDFLEEMTEACTGHRVIRQTAQSTGWTAERILRLARADEGKPAQLIWAFDVSRAVWMVRSSYMAGLITEDHAWRLIRQVADFAAEIYSSFDEYVEAFRFAQIHLQQQRSEEIEPILRRIHHWLDEFDWPAVTHHLQFSSERPPAATVADPQP